MEFPNFFADADADYEESDFVIFGIPYDKTSTFREGASYAPDEIRKASWNFETYNFKTGFDLKEIKIHDYGNLEVFNKKPSEMVKIVNDFTKKLLKDKKFPIAIGGDHSITAGIVSAFNKDISILSLDAHLDFRDSYENEKYNHACVIKRISEYIKIENIAILGFRSADKQEFFNAKKENLFFIDSFDIQKNGVKNAINKTTKILGNNKIYLTFDIDVLDPAYLPGTSTPEPFGLNPFEIKNIINSFSSNIVGFDIVEVCPKYDQGISSLLAAKFIRLLIEEVYLNKK